MSDMIAFREYRAEDKAGCLSLFDLNCPEFFAPNERADYEAFLAAAPAGYEVCIVQSEIAGAFGLVGNDPARKSLNWILLNPKAQGRGLGSAVMRRVVSAARARGVPIVDIAASHKSASFFAKFGATEVARTEHGWGQGMHRVDMELRA
jgi:GNAT superfamily N-acetyltransferase